MTDRVPSPEKPPTVLLIDDNCEDRDYWSTLLQNEPIGFVVLKATCGDSGFKLFQRQHIDCVVLDLEMPESGLFTLLRLIPDPARRHVPDVILTKFAQPALSKILERMSVCSKNIVPQTSLQKQFVRQ